MIYETPRVIRKGKSDCVHYERIDSAGRGTCSKCGRVKQYPVGLLSEARFNPISGSMASKLPNLFVDWR